MNTDNTDDIPMDPDDIILKWLMENDYKDYCPFAGFSIIPYTPGIYIVLGETQNHRPKYVGWFCVSEKSKLNTDQFAFLCEIAGMYLHRNIGDSMPEIPEARTP